jgi:hypothetical protein
MTVTTNPTTFTVVSYYAEYPDSYHYAKYETLAEAEAVAKSTAEASPGLLVYVEA